MSMVNSRGQMCRAVGLPHTKSFVVLRTEYRVGTTYWNSFRDGERPEAKGTEVP